MKSEPGMSRREVDDLLLRIGDDEETRNRLAKVLRSELAGTNKKRAGRVRDIGRLRR